MEVSTNYIIPQIRVFQSFEEARSKLQTNGGFDLDDEGERSLEDYFIFHRTFVVAEAGYGKTRLLRELVLQSKLNGKDSIYADLKKLPPSENLGDFIKSQADRGIKLSKISDYDNLVICLDALDEVRQEYFSSIVEKIKVFVPKHPNTNIVISSRWHFFQKYQELFIDLDFRYAHISPFSLDKVRLYLKQKFISEEDIDKLLDPLHFSHRDLIIQTPRYLKLFVDYIEEKGVTNVGSLSRSDLFEHFIYKKLEIEDKKLNMQKRNLIKRVLEKLALIMEIYQTNILTKDELMTFFDDLKSDLKVSLLQQVPLEVFYDKTVLKDNIDTIEFDNTEFQEYLAAKEIIRLGHPQQVIFDLSVDPELREIYPSWFNTLTFLIELDISLLKPIIDFGSRKRGGWIQDEEYHRFLTRVNLHQLPKSDQKIIFEEIFTYYQSILHWIDWNIAKNLAAYFDLSQHDLLKSYLNKKRYGFVEERFVQLGNIAQIVGFILERDIFNSIDRAFWRNKLIKFANDRNENGVIQRHALFALQNLKDDSIIDAVADVWNRSDQLIKDRFLELCIEVNPNHDSSLKFFVEGVKIDSIHARYGLYRVYSSQAINRLLQYFKDDEVFLSKFLDRERIFKEKDGQLIANIKSVWNETVKDRLQVLIKKAFESKQWYHAERSEFIKNISLLLKEKDRDYIFELINQINSSERLKKNLFCLQSIFVLLLEKDQVNKFVDMLSNLEHGNKVALSSLQQIKFSSRSEAEEIYEEGRQYFTKEYTEAEKYWRKQKRKPTAEDHICRDFQRKLQPSPGLFMMDVFEFYVRNSEIINKRMINTEREKLIELVTDTVFDKFDPAMQEVKIIKQDGGGKSYNTHSWIQIFGDCLKVAQKLKLDVSKLRTKIISYIPFAYHEHLKAIFELVKDIKSTEIKSLLKVYTDKSSDLWRHMPGNLIDASKKYVIIEAVPILKEFVNREEFSTYERIGALEASEILKPDKYFLSSIFKRYLKTQKKLAEKANKLLIERHKDEKAIDWMFKQVQKRAFTFAEPNSAHSVGEEEAELHDKEFASSLMRLKDLKYQNKYLELLMDSFRLIKRNKSYYSYAQYIWQIVYAYFDNLKEKKSYKPLKDLEDYLQKHSHESGANWFSGRIRELRRSYMNFIGKPSNVSKCIQIYNNFKAGQYLEITSPADLLEKAKDIINKELKAWVIGEGQKIIKAEETDIQKYIKIQLENGFLRKGFRPQEVTVIREPQLQDDKRTDFIIFYGFIGPIIIEVKLSRSSDLKGQLENKKSFKSMKHYMDNYKAYFGIFLVIDNQFEGKRNNWTTQLKLIKTAYERIDNVEVLGISM